MLNVMLVLYFYFLRKAQLSHTKIFTSKRILVGIEGAPLIKRLPWEGGDLVGSLVLALESRHSVHNPSTGEQCGRVPKAHWLASLAYLSSSRTMGDFNPIK